MSPSSSTTPRAPAPRRLVRIALAALLAVAAALACSQPSPPQAGGVSGTYDLARVGNLVFVTSADRSELRVLDARMDGGVNGGAVHDWVRAPNPLEVLQIPVVERPVGLARDLAWSTADVDETTPYGGEVVGPYLYAFASARPEISVVGADRSILKELKKLATDGPVTAVAAFGPTATGGSTSTLFYATLVAGTANLYSVSLAPPDQIAAQAPAPSLLASYPGETVAALQALPRHGEIAVATRTYSVSGGAITVGGRTFALTPSSPGTPRPFAFGAPIRALATHPGLRDPAEGVPPELLLFGMVDEESCGGSGGRACARILAVDVDDGGISSDFSGGASLPIYITTGLPQTMTIAADTHVSSLTSSGALSVPLMGMVTSSDGNITFFEALGRPLDAGTQLPDGGYPPHPIQRTLRHLNQASLSGVATNFFYVPVRADGGTVDGGGYPNQDPDAGPVRGLEQATSRVGLGSAVAEPLAVTFQGEIPGLTDLSTAGYAGDTSLPLPAGAPSARAHPGDRVVLEMGDGAACPDLVVASVSATSIDTTAAPEAGCSGWTSYSVRAHEPDPYVVTGLVSGYMGRVGDNAEFIFQGTPYYRPDNDPQNTAPALKFFMRDRTLGIERGARFQFQTSTGFSPLFFILSTDVTAWPGFHLPYGVVHMPGVPRVYVSYPSVARSSLLGSGAVIEFNPTLMAPNQPNVQITSAYR